MSNDSFPFQIGPTPERGGCLTTLLIVAMGFYLLIVSNSIFLTLAYRRGHALPEEMDPHLIPTVGVLSLMMFVGLWGIWRWRRWGLILISVAAIISFAFDLLLLRAMFLSVLYVPPALMVLWLLRRRWGYFR